MWARLSIVAGLIAGILVAALVLGGILAFAPAPVSEPTPAPSVTLPSPSANPSSAVVPTTSPEPSGSPDAGASGPTSSAAALFGIGEPAPALNVPQVGGGTIDLANLRGQPVWVNFMGTYCPPCQDEFPLMNGFAARYGETGLVVIAVDVREDEGTVAAFADRLNAVFPLGLDNDGSVAKAWKADLVLPVHFWIDKEGIVRDGAFGGIGPDIMARGLGSILPGVDVTP
jgi:thiol-disulfide isomerase/thioredoxin